VTWLAAKHSLQKVWIWCTHHWKLVALFAYTLLMWIVFRRGDSNTPREVLEIRKEAHQKEMAAVTKAHEEEVKIREENLESYQKTITKIEKEYEKEERTLTKDKRKRVKKLVEDYREEPEKLTEIVSVMFGIRNEKNNNS
jgi:vacuolar-type H+-ATPase subunit H